MAKASRTEISRSPDRPLSETASARPASRNNKNTADEFIVKLADAHETKRARQVTEWERSQSLYLRQSA